MPFVNLLQRQRMSGRVSLSKKTWFYAKWKYLSCQSDSEFLKFNKKMFFKYGNSYFTSLWEL